MKIMTVSKNLKELILEHKFSQQAVATKIGVSQRAVSKWLRGEADPTASNIFNLATLFAVSAYFLLGLNEY